jgi:hypothetical protein
MCGMIDQREETEQRQRQSSSAGPPSQLKSYKVTHTLNKEGRNVGQTSPKV